MIYRGEAVRDIKSKDLLPLLEALGPDETVVAGSAAWPWNGSATSSMAKGATKPGVLLLTNERVIIAQKGLLGGSYNEVDLQDVLTVEFKPGRLGDPMAVLAITTRAGTFGVQFTGRGADKKDGPLWPSIILRAQEESAGPVPVAPTSPQGNDLAGQLAALTDLHASGALSDDEFGAAKRRLLS